MKDILFITFIFIAIKPLEAQLPIMEIEGKPKLLNENVELRSDINGRLCSAIKIKSDIKGFKYDSYNGIVGDVMENPGQDIVYLSSDERVLIVFHAGFEPLKIILSEFGVRLKEKQIWEITVIAGTLRLLPVSFVIQPADAQLFVDGKAMGISPAFQLNHGKHLIKVAKQGYLTVEDTIKINADNVLFKYLLVIKPEMIIVEGGIFEMGSNEKDDEKPIHNVTLNSFYICKYEVTQQLWSQVMGTNPSYIKGDSLPVDNVSWYDAIQFCDQLSILSGYAPCYIIDKGRTDPNNYSPVDDLRWIVKCDFSAKGYRLPTEAEWEYASRGGSYSHNYKYSGSDNVDDVAWYKNNSNERSHFIGTKQPNEIGICDMSGNIEEWCWDWYIEKYYSKSPSKNPTGSPIGGIRVARSGDFKGDVESMRTTNRIKWGFGPNFRDDKLGIRLCRSCIE